MTCREKLAIEHPDCVDDDYFGGCVGCPHDYGYLPRPAECGCSYHVTDYTCTACWGREIPDESSNVNRSNTEKENNMATTKKTKAELEKELENVKATKAELEKDLKNLEKYKQYENMAGEVYAIYMSFVHAGFFEEQAYGLLKTMIQNANNITFNNAYTFKPAYRSYK